MRMRPAFLIWLILVLAAVVLVGAQEDEGDEEEEKTGEETEEKTPYLFPADAYPAVEIFGGISNGITYRDGVYRSAKRAAGAGNVGETLDDIGRMLDIGAGIRYVIFRPFDFGIAVFHQFGKEHSTVFRYDYSAVDPYVKPPQYVDDYISYDTNNLDCKIRVGLDPFPEFLVAPYVSAGVGVNYMELAASNYIPGKKTHLTFFYPGNDIVGHFSFDYAFYGGLRLNFTRNYYIFAEAFYDRPFSNHYYFEYLLKTNSTGVHGGIGVRLR